MIHQVNGSVVVQTSIVVLSYNGCDALTRPCVESLLKNTPQGNYELILVDNASSDSTREYLRDVASQHPFVKLCLNSENKGYAGGNNDGLRLATGQFIVLLNNDTLVGPGWLNPLIERLESMPDIGLIGPVTNSAGNEQRVDLPELNAQNFVEIAGQYTQAQKGRWFETEKLGFYCVAARREVIQQVGLLDEGFGLGMFEDDDYCVRVRQAGYKLVVVEDSFVYHKGSMSFKTLPSADYLQLFEKNRAYFFKKHEVVWTYSGIAHAIWRVIKRAMAENSNASRQSVLARLELMNDALYQLRQREENSVLLDGVSAAEHKLAEKHRQLMEISDWATTLKNDNEALSTELSQARASLMEISDWATSLKNDNAVLSTELSQARASLMEISDWATSLKNDNAWLSNDLARIRSSWPFRLLRRLKFVPA
ncbi:glycosyltransferase family 2 protein [Comamonas aquatica]|uniref:glycosyltransferase family 2 protein n=1 Tax=Comamonas aquatica TaxID=225991 RepID=UPI0021B0E9E1|nr:glycosyltransferase family 2 protein [Comamonas aquatica]